MIKHPISPVYDDNSEILILGSFPSVKSREQGFFYGHPQNRFWRVVSAVFGCSVPVTVDEKVKFLLENRIAVWDVIGSCEITGSSDSSIKNVVPNDLSQILDKTDIKKIFLNGRMAEKYYRKYAADSVKLEAVCLPSTSPANAAWSEDMLIDAWSVIKE